MIVRFLNIFILLSVFFSIFVYAELNIEVTQGVENPTPIAIVPFGGVLLKDKTSLSDIVSADLLRSGLLQPIPRADMLSLPSQASDIIYRDWRILGANYLLIGNIKLEVGEYKLTYELVDVLAQRLVFKKTLTVLNSKARNAAHQISDDVYEAITGIRGAFNTQIIYVEDFGRGDKRYRLMKADADGAREKVLFQSSQPILSPTWSNDGNQVAYVSFETTRPAIFRQNLITGTREQLTNFQGLNGAPSWSPDDKTLALVLSKDGNPEIYLLEIASKKLRRLTVNSAIDTEPNWNNDGTGIIFTSNRGGSPQIYQMGVASGRVERLTFDGNYNARPRVSPDGKSFVMVHRHNDIFHIAWQDIASGDIRILTQTWLDESPTIAPNGALLLYATQSNNKGVLAAVSLDAGVKYLLPSKKGNVREPAWSPYLNE